MGRRGCQVLVPTGFSRGNNGFHGIPPAPASMECGEDATCDLNPENKGQKKSVGNKEFPGNKKFPKE